MRLDRLSRVQALEGNGSPFERLSASLLGWRESHVGIDAPFSIPAAFIADEIGAVWRAMADCPFEGRPFPRGRELLRRFCPGLVGHGAKHLRQTEDIWRQAKINVRSTTWNGPRGGAPFTAACMTLLARHSGPVWPFRETGDGAVLCEAFPAAQLNWWRAPHAKYDGPSPEAAVVRRAILREMTERRGLRVSAEHEAMCLASADALDAVVCVYAARAVDRGRIAGPSPELRRLEGQIAVHD